MVPGGQLVALAETAAQGDGKVDKLLSVFVAKH